MLPIREIGILDGRKRSSFSGQRNGIGLGCRSGARTGQKKTAQQESQSFYRHIVQYRLRFHQWKLDPKQLILPDDPYIAGNQQPVARGEVLQPDSGPRRRIDFRNNGIGNREHTAFGTDCDAHGRASVILLCLTAFSTSGCNDSTGRRQLRYRSSILISQNSLFW